MNVARSRIPRTATRWFGDATAGSSSRPFSGCCSRASHVGSLPIACPPNVQLIRDTVPPSSSPASSGSSTLRVVGPKGELAVNLKPFVQLSHQESSLPTDKTTEGTWVVSVDNASIKDQRAVWGLTRSLLANAVYGVSSGYTLSLRLVGVGYRAVVEDATSPSGAEAATSPIPAKRLNLKLGYAHPVIINLPSDVQAATPTATTIVLSGIDKQRLGEVAARIRSWRVPEPYNVRYLRHPVCSPLRSSAFRCAGWAFR